MIRRHKIERAPEAEYEIVKGRLEKNKRKLIKRINQGAFVNLGGYKETNLEFVIFSLVLNVEDDISKELDAYLELGIRNLQMEFCKKSSLYIELGGQKLNIDCTEKNGGVSLFNWWRLLNVSMILRNEGAKEELLELLDEVLTHSNDPFWKRSIDLILMSLGKKQFENKILDNLESISLSGISDFHGIEKRGLVFSEDSSDIKLNFWLPIFKLYYYVLMKNQKDFNKALENYLIWKSKWIIDNKEENNSSYWIDFPLLACCSYAHDKGISVDVESEYIPAFVFKGDF